ncbi:hypothetical protein [Ferrimonas senticii]|uniref:hypothetical protein n=1 Tax=Ferrimonas senticii TaxID=394566 RepID=UPI0004041704|nr:hypothetical protein [Ferrimonas senticii]
MKKCWFNLLLILALSPVMAAEKYDQAYYQSIFEQPHARMHIDAASSLQWAGLSDPALFDLVAKRLEEVAPFADSKQNIDHAAWLIKALGFSGNEKYREVLVQYQGNNFHKKLRKYANQANTQLSLHAQWNPIINDRKLFDDQQSLHHNRLANMLRSDQLELKRIAAKRIHYDHFYTPYLLNLLEQQLKQEVATMGGSKLAIDTYAWMTKALAGSSQYKYRPTVQAIADQAPERKLRKYANRYLNYFK